MFALVNVNAKVKQSLHRPQQVLRVQEVDAPTIFRQLAHEGGKVVSPTYWQPLLEGDIRSTRF